jgi:DNA polymerase elongation subunit (family B)
MKFYTNVSRFGNNLLVRGYQDGKRIKRKVKFSPTLFVPSTKESKYKTLDGLEVSPVEFDTMRDAKEFLEKYEDVENFRVYGNSNYIAQYIAAEYPGVINFDKARIRIADLDIEVASDDGFPEPEQAEHEIISITLYDSICDIYFVWGLGEYEVEMRDEKIKACNVKYTRCKDETALLKLFMMYWCDEFTAPDVVTGWNIRAFDIPYLVNRMNRLFGEDAVKALSPWGSVQDKMISMRKGQVQIYDIMGVAQIDYMDLFMKFGYSFGPQESYSLNHIANVVLGEEKLSYEEYGSLHTLYKENHQKFIDYNIRDVNLVEQMEDKIGLLMLCFTMAYKAGVNFSDTFGTVGIWDTLIYRYLLEQDIVVPPNKESFKSDYEGGYVKEPQCGVHDWVASFDVNSLYPNIIVQWNMSPETILRGQVEPNMSVDRCLAEFKNPHPNMSMAASGQYFDNSKQGFMPKIIEAMYDERVQIKKKMIDAKKALEKADKTNKSEVYAIERDIATYDNQQMTVKILLNSLYGALGNKYFRYFTMEIAEGITLTGQFIIKWAEKNVNAYLNNILKTRDDYVIAIDTDSVYVTFGKLVEHVMKDKPKDKVVDFLDKVCAKVETDVLDTAFTELFENTGAFKKRISMKREGIADRGIWVAKKRYILNVWDNEGVRYKSPKLKMMGIEAIKSSTPAPCREAFQDMFKILINGTEKEMQEFIVKFRNDFNSLPVEAKAFPRGVSAVRKYVDKKTNMYIKGTPINSRAAILHNFLLDRHDVKTIAPIKAGDKIKYVYLNPRNPLHEDVIGFRDILPREFGLHLYVDNTKQFDKAFLEPANLILEAIGWSAEETTSLEGFFG